MTPERWRQITQVFHAARAREGEARRTLLDEACAGDSSLRAEVDALLLAHAEAGGFGEGSALADVVAGTAPPDLLAHQALSHYHDLFPIGSGGMGVVYRALDTRLGRYVAIKVLPADHMADEDRRRRFVQEARAASALNHPNIVTIHEIDSAGGIDFMVMEYVRGKPLDALIPRQGMPLGEALRIAVAIADALVRAHAAGIVHRDVKPSNVMIGDDGIVKVLDFGLAKLVDVELAAEDPPRPGPPVRAEKAGQSDVIAGTAGYMSPEQATAGEVDPRSDVFSFGALLYEMVTGRRPFAGESPAETLAKVVREQPPAPRAVAPDTPADVEDVILRCLRKEPARRFQRMREVKEALEQALERRRSVPNAAAVAARRGPARGTILAPVVALALAGAGWALLVRRPAPPAPRLVALTTMRGSEWTPALSPDGEQVAFAWEGESGPVSGAVNTDIWVVRVGAAAPRRLTSDPHHDLFPAWSPDGRTIAFFRSATRYQPVQQSPQIRGFVYVVPAAGGPERRLHGVQAGFSQLAWTPDGRAVVARGTVDGGEPASRGGLFLFPIDGADPSPLTMPPPPAFDVHPAFSPDARRLAWASCGDHRNPIPPCALHVADVDARGRPQAAARRLSHKVAGMVLGLAWTQDGKSIVFGAGGAAGDLWRLDVDGDGPGERIELTGRRAVFPSTAGSRARVAFTRSLADRDIYRFEAGHPATVVIGSSYSEYAPSFSPDGRRIALESSRSGEREVWLADADGSNPVQLTRGPGSHQGSPRWSPDGRSIVFDAQGTDGYRDVWTIPAAGGAPRRVTNGPMTETLASWSRDGRWIYFREDRADGRDIWKVAAEGGTPVRITVQGGLLARESADGRWLFYTKADPTSPLYRLALAGGAEREAVGCVQSRSLADGPDGLYYLGCGDDPVPLYRLDPATGASRLLGHLDTGAPSGAYLAVSPADGTVLFSRLSGGADLMMIDGFR